MKPLPILLLLTCVATATVTAYAADTAAARPRARDAGIVIGTLPTGAHNAITDVEGVGVGHATLAEGTRFNTGVTAIVPHPGNLYRERVPAAIVVGNGFGKLLGITQVQELGELETPVLLTGTLGVWKVADALTTHLLAQPGMEQVRSINPVVGETNDGYLSDIRARPLGPTQVERALAELSYAQVEEGAVGAGAGTVAFGWKGGIGTSSRRLDAAHGGYTVGVLVQSNFGGRLTVAGVPVWKALPDPASLARVRREPPPSRGDGSIMIVVATDAPLDPAALRRVASRALTGLARTGSDMSNGSGDYVIAFSTAVQNRRRDVAVQPAASVANDAMTPLFQATAEATEEAILNSMLRARTVEGHQGTAPALPLAPLLRALDEAGARTR